MLLALILLPFIALLSILLPPLTAKAFILHFSHSDEEWPWIREGCWGQLENAACGLVGAIVLVVLIFSFLKRKGLVE